jgi:hypothetical protein
MSMNHLGSMMILLQVRKAQSSCNFFSTIMLMLCWYFQGLQPSAQTFIQETSTAGPVDNQSATSNNFSMQAFLQGKPRRFLQELCSYIFRHNFYHLISGSLFEDHIENIAETVEKHGFVQWL